MNCEKDIIENVVFIERLRMIEQHIEELEDLIKMEKELFLKEDLKVRGIQ
ncbi:MAG TPA: hypothetical protein VMZ04_02280 [Anaerolineae bacterium]|nr:hypothetical protein [Anaerolineae bacterium]